MDKKYLMPLALVLVISLGVFVIAGELNWGFTTATTETETKEVYLIEGWNLIQGFGNPSFITSSSIGKEKATENIKAIFAFSPLDKKYVKVYPIDSSSHSSNPDRIAFDSLPPAVLQLPFWVYSSKGGYSISYETQKLDSTFQITWPSGWNLVSISNEMVGKNLNEIKGSCNIEKAYWWSDKENSKGSWVSFPSDISFDRSLVGLGIALKFSSECKLGSSSSGSGSTITAPPAIPNDNGNEGECIGTDGGTIIDVKGTVTRNGETKEDFCETSDLLVEYDCDWDNGGIIRELKFSCSDLSFSRCENGRCI
jgi:hypothetical protein